MSGEELLHVRSNCGPGGAWVRVTPLSWKAWEMKPKQWLVSARRRLSVPIAPYKIKCRACKGGWCDVSGEHQVECAGLGSRIWRHNTIRDILAVEVRNAGYEVTIEQNGGSGLDDKPGDIRIHRWSGDKDLLIDTAVINPRGSNHRRFLAGGGVGAAATAYEDTKIQRYAKLIDYEKYDFLPFILEVQGGIGDRATAFIQELIKRKRQRLANLSRGLYNAKNVGFANLDIIAALSIEVQRANAENILQRLPRDNTLKVSEIRRCKLSAIEVREEARRRIEERKKNNLKDHWSPTVDKKDLEERKVDSEVHKQPSRGIKNRTSLNELNVKNVVTWELSDEEIDFEAHPHPLPILPQANNNKSNNTYVKGREQIRNLETSPDSDKHSLNPKPKSHHGQQEVHLDDSIRVRNKHGTLYRS